MTEMKYLKRMSPKVLEKIKYICNICYIYIYKYIVYNI